MNTVLIESIPSWLQVYCSYQTNNSTDHMNGGASGKVDDTFLVENTLFIPYPMGGKGLD